LSYFLPLHRRRWKHRGRAFNSHLPLFPGYLFLFGDANARQSAWQTNLVIQVLTVPDQQRIHEDLARVHRLLASGEPVTPEDRLRPGTKVVISRGSFVGLEGTILRRDAQLRFVVEVQLLQRGVSLEVEEWMFETLGRVIADQPHDTSSHAHCSANGSTSAGPRPGLAGGFGGLS
jgi:transcriptional antiterminator RfaH